MKRLVGIVSVLAMVLPIVLMSFTVNAEESEVLASSVVISVASGENHTLFLKDDGTVWAVGNNNCGQLGCGADVLYSSEPVRVSGLQNIRKIETKANHCAAIDANDNLWLWGLNDRGQLGNGTRENCYVPFMADITSVRDVSTGWLHTVALRYDGTVWSWGVNESGQLGTGDTKNRYTPQLIEGLNLVEQVAAGYRHTLALTNTGAVYTFGCNNFGQQGLNIASSEDALVPTIVPLETTASKVACGKNFSVVLLTNGNVWSWGRNNCGQLGNGTRSNSNIPVMAIVGAAGSGKIVNIKCNAQYVLAQKESGTIVGWGDDGYYKLGGRSENGYVLYPQVLDYGSATDFAPGNQHVVCILENGNIVARGWNYYGQCGNAREMMRNMPEKVIGLSQITKVYGNANQTIAKQNSNVGWIWGSANGTDDPYAYVETELQLYPDDNMSHLYRTSDDGTFDVKVEENGTVYTRGANTYGQLGGGATPTPAVWTLVSGLSNIVDVQTNGEYCVALDTRGFVYTWGRNNDGQLGNGTQSDANTPGQVIGVEHVASIAVNETTVFAIKDDGNVYVWGNGRYIPDTNDGLQLTPVLCTSLNGVAQISCGAQYCGALKTDGTVWCWGNNDFGQLGNGTQTNSATPQQVVSLTNVEKISAGAYHMLAIKTNGSLWAWGENSSGQLGDGTYTDKFLPVCVESLSDVKDIHAGAQHSVALHSNGTVYTWGDNTKLQLGKVAERTVCALQITYPAAGFGNKAYKWKAGEIVQIVTKGAYISDSSALYRLNYDASGFELLNASMQSGVNIVTPGVYNSVTILSVEDGAITFKMNRDIQQQNMFFGTMNMFEFLVKRDNNALFNVEIIETASEADVEPVENAEV